VRRNAAISADRIGVLDDNGFHTVLENIAVDSDRRISSAEVDGAAHGVPDACVAADGDTRGGIQCDTDIERVARDRDGARRGGYYEDRRTRLPNELVVSDQRSLKPEIHLDSITAAGPGIVVVLDYVALHLGQKGASVVQFDAGNVVL